MDRDFRYEEIRMGEFPFGERPPEGNPGYLIEARRITEIFQDSLKNESRSKRNGFCGFGDEKGSRAPTRNKGTRLGRTKPTDGSGRRDRVILRRRRPINVSCSTSSPSCRKVLKVPPGKAGLLEFF